FGYLVAVAILALVAYALNIWPGWESIPFVTGEAAAVMGVLNVGLIVGIVFNVVYIAFDPPRLKVFGDLVSTVIGLTVLVRLWRVYPVDFSGYGFSWDAVTRTLVVVGMIGSGVGILAQLVLLARGPAVRSDTRREPSAS